MKMKNDVSFLFDKTMSLYEHQSTYNPNMPEEVKELYLSDAFDREVEPGKFEWTATMVNINAGMNPELLEKCKVLGGYATFVDKVRTYNQSMPLTEAVDQAVDECVEAGVLEEFLSRHRREVRNMVLTEFDEEKFLKMMRAEERAEGIAIGRMESLEGILRELGEIPTGLLECAKDLDADTLKRWTKLAVKAESIQEFLEQIKKL